MYMLGSSRERALPQADERLGGRERPGPVLSRVQEDLRWPRVLRAVLQEPIAQRLGLGSVQVRLGGEQHRLGQGEQVRGDQGEFDPDLVDFLVPGQQATKARVFAALVLRGVLDRWWFTRPGGSRCATR